MQPHSMNEALYWFNIRQLARLNSKLQSIAPKVVKAEKPEKKRKRGKKDKNAPKKPMSAFFCYQQARRASLKQESPELNHKDIIRVNFHLPYPHFCRLWLKNGNNWLMTRRSNMRKLQTEKRRDMNVKWRPTSRNKVL